MSLPDSVDQATTLVIRDARVQGKQPALIVALHGYGMDERQIETLVNIDPGFDHVLIAPRAPIALAEGGFAWAPLSLHDGGPTVEQDDLNTFVKRFTKYIAKMTTATDADPDRVYIVGYSQGGAMAITLALMTGVCSKIWQTVSRSEP